ncbi:phosphoribosylglycinamide formyltransferase [Selenomonas sp. oral taxon 478]|uniref:phosphoribosylglycinamide formyltransferase n=1 Tax=Selenomonas sp. oral taxon 478 TaxID=712538 RepID=UPI00067A3DDB|nr:phosphoribosylglycinamide formyltransferase [Selenomonas sp. oral taxon 478]AKT52980.1 phosphoribosylglycinamide formyltransferase [Selenomonas sp. oral taxon 478]
MPKEKIGVLCSGRGSNLASIIDAVERGDIRAEIAVVLADKADAYALTRAREHSIPDVAVVRKAYAAREDFERALLEQLHAHGVTLVVLAGFMRILSPLFVRAYAGRILNIHPALLPSFPGAHAHRDALAYGVKVSGCTVHFVDEGTDSGPIILQAAVPVAEGDTEDSLAARVLKEEHRIFPAAIRLYVDGRLRTDGRQVHILPLAEGGAL